MYNYSAELKYRCSEDDEIYRKELLDCFYLEEYTDDINKQMVGIYDTYREKYNRIFSALKETKHVLFTNLPEASLFIVLFSWEYWLENHLFLQSLQKGNDVDIKICETQLLNKIVGLGK
jgi:hypothetical protein